MPSKFPFHHYRIYQYAPYRKEPPTYSNPFDFAIAPGWNIVYLGSEPMMTAINDVLPPNHPSDMVVAYDPTQPGAWFSASRPCAGEPLEGSLKNIRARTKYWVHN